MSITISGSTVTFNDGSTQTTGIGTSLDTIGSYVSAYYIPWADIATNSTCAGSNLRYNPTNTFNGINLQGWGGSTIGIADIGSRGAVSTYGSTTWGAAGSGGAYYANGGSALSGTWRKLSATRDHVSVGYSYGTAYIWVASIYIRIS